jgi:hypothetical protein
LIFLGGKLVLLGRTGKRLNMRAIAASRATISREILPPFMNEVWSPAFLFELNAREGHRQFAAIEPDLSSTAPKQNLPPASS